MEGAITPNAAYANAAVISRRPGPDDKSKLASAFLKSATNVTVLGILVKHDAKAFGL